jgi:hypothetical protein
MSLGSAGKKEADRLGESLRETGHWAHHHARSIQEQKWEREREKEGKGDRRNRDATKKRKRMRKAGSKQEKRDGKSAREEEADD